MSGPWAKRPRLILHYACMIYAFAPFTAFALVTATMHKSICREAFAILMACVTEFTMTIENTKGREKAIDFYLLSTQRIALL